MDAQLRLVAGVVFAVTVFLLVQAWMREREAVAPPASTPSAAGDTAGPPAPTTSLGGREQSADASAPAAPSGVLQRGNRLEVRTDFLIAQIDANGGDLRRVELTRYKDRIDPSRNFVLLDDGPGYVYVAQSGLIGESLANHTSQFSPEGGLSTLGDGQEELKVRLRAPDSGGLRVVKVFTFKRSSYVVEVGFEITNVGAASIEPSVYHHLRRKTKAPDGDSKMVPTYFGAEIYTDQTKLTKVSLSDVLENKATWPKSATNGWIAIVQHYFLGAWLPRPGPQLEFFLRPAGRDLVDAGVILPVGVIEPGTTARTSVPLYVGPQEQDRLRGLAPGLELAVDYGWLRVLAVPLFWILQKIHNWVGNWGGAIIILTVIIKVLFYPLSAASYRSMGRMKVLAPKLQKLKERFGDDRQKLHQAMIELYKTEKINPLGGCLPIVVQIPVFIALYWVLLLSVELRQAPFMFWIRDLSRPDPFFILPILMGATMLIQTWLNPTPPDPVQARLMKIMPIAFSVFFFFFPAGLVLYWLVNNVLSIAQQWQITRSLERAKTAHGES